VIDDLLLKNALAKAASSGTFGDSAWLTFYLEGPTVKLESLVESLVPIGGQNLDGAEGGFVYAKLPVALQSDDIKQLASRVCSLATQHGVNVGLIDLDSTENVANSKFFTLYQSTHE